MGKQIYGILGICSFGNQPQFNYDVRSSYQKIITLGDGGGELCGNESILGPFLFEIMLMECHI